MNKMFRILEIVWLSIGLVAFAVSIYSTIKHDFSEAIYFLIFTLVAAMMYFMRKRQRKKME